MFYHFLLPLFCPCVSICGQLQEPPDLFVEIDTPYAELSCQQPFFYILLGNLFHSLVHAMCFSFNILRFFKHALMG